MKGAREGRDNDGWMDGRREVREQTESRLREVALPAARKTERDREMENGGKEDRLVGERKEKERNTQAGNQTAR